jgi:Domain of unknown function (DUF5667)
MIKSRFLFALAFLCFTFFIVLFSALRLSQPYLLSSTTSFQPSLNQQTCQDIYESTFSSLPVNYQLPYPGLLPDHPFYWTKMIRDRLNLIITTNPEQKLKFLLNYANKRLAAGIILASSNQTDLALTTLTKAEKYLHQSANFTFENFDSDKNPKIYEQLVTTYLIHDFHVRQTLDYFNDSQKDVLEKILQSNNSLIETKFADFLPQAPEASSSTN